MTQVVMTSEIFNEMRPIFEEFILNLGYTEEQAKLFAEGYIEAANKLPIAGKMMAASNQDPECMSAGFIKASINEEETLSRYENKKKEKGE